MFFIDENVIASGRNAPRRVSCNLNKINDDAEIGNRRECGKWVGTGRCPVPTGRLIKEEANKTITMIHF